MVSQFTLYADTRRGRRPDFTQASPPEEAERLYNHAVELFRQSGLKVATGVFQEYMQVRLQNDGPVTILLDQRRPPRAKTGLAGFRFVHEVPRRNFSDLEKPFFVKLRVLRGLY